MQKRLSVFQREGRILTYLDQVNENAGRILIHMEHDALSRVSNLPHPWRASLEGIFGARLRKSVRFPRTSTGAEPAFGPKFRNLCETSVCSRLHTRPTHEHADCCRLYCPKASAVAVCYRLSKPQNQPKHVRGLRGDTGPDPKISQNTSGAG